MATETTKTDQKQNQQSQGKAPVGGTQAGTQQGTLARRGGYNPFALSLTPTDFFSLNPLSLMRRMTEEMDRAFSGSGGQGNGGETFWAPIIEVSERDGKYVVHADLPGLKPEDVKAEVTGDALVIEGERKIEHEENKGGVRRTERRYGRFYRVIPLPDGTNVDEARAKFENGVLEVTVPVTQKQSNNRQIPVEASSSSGSGGESQKQG